MKNSIFFLSNLVVKNGLICIQSKVVCNFSVATLREIQLFCYRLSTKYLIKGILIIMELREKAVNKLVYLLLNGKLTVQFYFNE